MHLKLSTFKNWFSHIGKYNRRKGNATKINKSVNNFAELEKRIIDQ